MRKPRITKVFHTLSLGSNMAMTQRTVTLTLSHDIPGSLTRSRRSDSGLGSQGLSSLSSSLAGGSGGGRSPLALSHSVSSPQLQGAWNTRHLPGATPPLNIGRDSRKLNIASFVICYMNERLYMNKYKYFTQWGALIKYCYHISNINIFTAFVRDVRNEKQVI